MKRPSISTVSFARICSRHPWLTISLWILVVVASLVLIKLFIGDALTSDIKFTSDRESSTANTLLEERLRGETKAKDYIIIKSETLTVDDQAFQEFTGHIYSEVAALGYDVIDNITDYYHIGYEGLVSSDRHITIMPVVMSGSFDNAYDNIGQLEKIVRDNNGKEGFYVLITGDASLHKDWMEAAQLDLKTAEIFGIPIALIILVLVFGAVTAALVPLFLGIIAIILALAGLAIIGQFNQFSVFSINVIVAMGFALGIDYSLFIVSRYREERARGREKTEAITAAASTASRTVLFSGITVVLAFLGILIVPISIFQSIAVGAILVVLVAILATLTLLPAILSIMGDRINSLRIPFIARRLNDSRNHTGGFWDNIARIVMRRPVISLLIAIVILIAAIVPISSFKLGAAGVSTLPDRLEAKKGFIIIRDNFSFGLSSARIVIDGQIKSPPVEEGIDKLTVLLEADPMFYEKPTLTINAHNDLAELAAPILGDPHDDDAMDAVRRLRDKYIPQAFADVDATVLVTGAVAVNIDYIDISNDYMPKVFIFVLALSFVLLTIVFQSIVIPIKAILMNLLSVGAAYGLVVLVFQNDSLANFFGFQATDKFEAWIPIFLFCILFGLSMDYHVFLLSRIREHFDHTGNNTESVAFGLRSTGRIITGAALIMVAVFCGLAAGELIMFQQVGFGMAVAVLLDATIIRCILVPSAMRLLGQINWYLPRWLQWLPKVRLRE